MRLGDATPVAYGGKMRPTKAVGISPCLFRICQPQWRSLPTQRLMLLRGMEGLLGHRLWCPCLHERGIKGKVLTLAVGNLLENPSLYGLFDMAGTFSE